MKTIGLIGGMSWESTIEYYRIINEGIRKNLGGHHSGQLWMYSIDFAEVVPDRTDHDKISLKLVNSAKMLQKAGADCVLICTNTMHLFADDVQSSISIPLLSIVDATGMDIKEKKLKKVGLLGSLLVMESDFYKKRLKNNFGIEVIVPDPDERKMINGMIFDELCVGARNHSSKEKLISIVGRLIERGAEGIILGCTEIPLVIKQCDIKVPIFDTTSLHAKMAVRFALS